MRTDPNHSVSAWRQLAKRTMSSVLPVDRFITRGPAGSNSVCLTFDDGPHPQFTPAVLDCLSASGASATFFVIGRNVAKHPEIVGRIAAEGHTIGHHSFTHSSPAKTSAQQLMDEIDQTDELLVKITGKGSKLFRPPWGKLSAGKFLSLWRRKFCAVLWTVDPRDGERASTDELAGWFVTNPVAARDIILLHDDCLHTVGALPGLIDAIRKRKIEFTNPIEWSSR